jgi:DNA-binding beta-propeller fold protein YncE
VFAGTAKGNVNPIRTLEGQETLMARTTHELALNTAHDELIVPNPFAQALLIFRDNAGPNEKPLRVIQGPKTMFGGSMDTDNVSVDVANDELYVTQEGSDSILVFPGRGDGNISPKRILHGPKTHIRFPRRVTIDPVNNLMAVVASEGILMFNRTDEGDVAPKCVITGPKTGLGGGEGFTLSKALLYPPAKKIIFGGGAQRVPKGAPGRQKAFTAIWNYGDCGDVAPVYRLEDGSGVFDINPARQEIIMSSSRGIRIYNMPEAF